MVENFFSAGQLILAHLKAVINLPDTNIRPAPNEEWVIKNAVDKSIHVIFFDDQPNQKEHGSAGRGKSQISKQFWMVTISLRNGSDFGNAARTDAGDLVIQVLKALQGFDLSKDHRPLKREPCPKRNPDTGVFVHVPLMFSTTIII